MFTRKALLRRGVEKMPEGITVKSTSLQGLIDLNNQLKKEDAYIKYIKDNYEDLVELIEYRIEHYIEDNLFPYNKNRTAEDIVNKINDSYNWVLLKELAEEAIELKDEFDSIGIVGYNNPGIYLKDSYEKLLDFALSNFGGADFMDFADFNSFDE